MGRGLALQFKQAFPENFKAYVAACKRGEVTIGRMLVYDAGPGASPRYIVNFPTKQHWRAPSRLEYMELVSEVRTRAFNPWPSQALGAGIRGLAWEDVRGRIEVALFALSNARVVVLEPSEALLAALARKPFRSCTGERAVGDRRAGA